MSMATNLRFNGTIPYNHKNAEIQLVVEDDIISTIKIFMDGEMAHYDDTITDMKGNELKFTKRNCDAIRKFCENIIDKELEEDGREECTNMKRVRR